MSRPSECRRQAVLHDRWPSRHRHTRGCCWRSYHNGHRVHSPGAYSPSVPLSRVKRQWWPLRAAWQAYRRILPWWPHRRVPMLHDSRSCTIPRWPSGTTWAAHPAHSAAECVSCSVPCPYCASDEAGSARDAQRDKCPRGRIRCSW